MGQRKLDNLGVSAFCESMSMMMKSGIQTDEAIALLRQGGRVGPLERGLAVMQEETERGKGLSGAMEATGIFPEYAVHMAAAGETAGKLLAAIVVLAAMLAMVLPTFTDVYESLAGSLASSSYGYIGWAYRLCWGALLVLAAVSALALLGLVLWKGKGRGLVEKLLGRIPACAPIMESLGMFRFTSALSTYLASGAMQDLAVAESVKMVSYKPVEDRIRHCADRMEEGHGIAQAAYEEKLFEPVYGRMLLAGERSGSLEEVLRKLTRLLETHCMNLIDHLVGIVDPLLSGILVLAVGLSLLGAMLPLIGIMNAIG